MHLYFPAYEKMMEQVNTILDEQVNQDLGVVLDLISIVARLLQIITNVVGSKCGTYVSGVGNYLSRPPRP